MKNFELKENMYVVFKVADIRKYLGKRNQVALEEILNLINSGRLTEGKKENQYYVVNKDEPYSDVILSIIQIGELSKQENV